MYLEIRGGYKECIRMLNGLEKTLERKVPERERRWQLAEETAWYGVKSKESWPIGPSIGLTLKGSVTLQAEQVKSDK